MIRNIIINDIQRVELQEYVDFTNYLADYLFSFPQVISVYQMGGWTQPGISDIDLIVVVKESNKYDRKELNLLNKFLARSSKERYMLMHAPFVITESAFKHLNLFFYCSDLTKLRGEDIEINHNPSDLQEIAELYKLVSVLAHTYPRFCFSNNRVSLRSFLTFGYSLKHTYRIIQQFDASFKNKEIEDYVDRITNLRKQVIESNNINNENINSLIDFGKNVSKIMFKKIDEIIVDKIPFKPGKKNFLYIKNYKTVFWFVNGSKSFKLSTINGVTLLELPHSLAVFILMPVSSGILSGSQSKRIVGENTIKLNKHTTELLGLIEKPFNEYNSLFKNCKVFNGMSFELNTPFIWETRKFSASNVLDYARWLKYLIFNEKEKMKVSNIIKANKFDT